MATNYALRPTPPLRNSGPLAAFGAAQRVLGCSPNAATLIIDTGHDIIGILSVADERYTPYRGSDISLAIQRIEVADELVTYNGIDYDLEVLGEFAGLPKGKKLPLKGIHTDMQIICWSDRIRGSSLRNTYLMYFSEHPNFPDTYEGSNELDVYMTFKLWELWKQEQLKILDGHDVLPPAP